MKDLNFPIIRQNEALLYFLGQAGYIIHSCNTTITIDPYLSDSVAKVAPLLARVFPVPIDPEKLKVDVFIVTHDHLDHLDPETIAAYSYKKTTTFIAPRNASQKLKELGISNKNISVVDAGQSISVGNVTIQGIYAVPSEPNVVDTTGYFLTFSNGRNLYHTSDTGFSPLLLDAAPKCEILCTCINGKWGNLNIHEAAELAKRTNPLIAIPNHYDLMALNSENPAAFGFVMRDIAPKVPIAILSVLEPFVWNENGRCAGN